MISAEVLKVMLLAFKEIFNVHLATGGPSNITPSKIYLKQGMVPRRSV